MKDHADSQGHPPLGSIIVVKHLGICANGALRNPVFWRQMEYVAGDNTVTRDNELMTVTDP